MPASRRPATPILRAPNPTTWRANAAKDALVREGVLATAITVIGRGEQGLLMQTADGVRELQNRRDRHPVITVRHT